MAAIVLALLLWRVTIRSDTEGPVEPQTETSLATEPARAGEGLQNLAKALSGAAAATFGLVAISGQVSSFDTRVGIGQAEVIFSGPSGESSVTCDEQGRYSIELQPGLYRSYAQAQGYVAVAYVGLQRLPGPVSADQVLSPQEGIAPLLGVFRNQRNVNLALSPAARIFGHVRNDFGVAISGAIVSTHQAEGRRVISGSDTAESDSSGFYELLVPLGRTELEAHHEDYAQLAAESADSASFDSAGTEAEVDLVLSEGCIIDGEVLDESGEPILDGAFEIQVSDKRYLPVGEIRGGRVRYASLDLGTVRLRAWPWKSSPSETLEFSCTNGAYFGDQRFIVPFAEPGLSGTILGHDGNAVPLAFVDLFSLMPGGATQQERADISGEFAFYDLPDGPYQVSVYIPGRGLALILIESPSSGVTLKLSGTGSIVGQLQTRDNTTMTMTYRCIARFDDDELAITDSVSMPEQTLLVPVQDGRFRVDKLPACPLRGTLRINGNMQYFDVKVLPDTDTVMAL